MRYAGKCIDVEGDPGVTDGTRVQLHPCEWGWNVSDQRWELRSDGLIENQLNRGKCIDADGDPATWESAALHLWDCEAIKTKSDQRWIVAQWPEEELPRSVEDSLSDEEKAMTTTKVIVTTEEPVSTPESIVIVAAEGDEVSTASPTVTSAESSVMTTSERADESATLPAATTTESSVTVSTERVGESTTSPTATTAESSVTVSTKLVEDSTASPTVTTTESSTAATTERIKDFTTSITTLAPATTSMTATTSASASTSFDMQAPEEPTTSSIPAVVHAAHVYFEVANVSYNQLVHNDKSKLSTGVGDVLSKQAGVESLNDISDMAGNPWRVSLNDNASTWTYVPGVSEGHNPPSVVNGSTIFHAMIRPQSGRHVDMDEIATQLKSPSFQSHLEAELNKQLGENSVALTGTPRVVQAFVWPEDVTWKPEMFFTTCTCADGSEGLIFQQTCMKRNENCTGSESSLFPWWLWLLLLCILLAIAGTCFFLIGALRKKRTKPKKQKRAEQLQSFEDVEAPLMQELDPRSARTFAAAQPAREQVAMPVQYVVAPAADAFDRLDRNHDGVLTRDELPGPSYQHVVGPAKYVTMPPVAGVDAFDLLDRNHDGVLTRDELPGPSNPQVVAPVRYVNMSPVRVADAFDRLDRNHDGVLSRDELPGPSYQQVASYQQVVAPVRYVTVAPASGADAFDRLDRNHDGVLSREEFGGVPVSSVGFDVNRNGRADYVVTGVDLNQDGLPDVLQQGRPVALEPVVPGPTRLY